VKKHVLAKRERNPTKFDALSVFAAWGQNERVELTHKDAVSRFSRFLKQSLNESLKSDTLLYGNRTQALFEAVVANLGAVQIVKGEDSGDIYSADTTIEVPDTRVVLEDGRNLLVETKNHHANWDKPYRMKATHVDGLSRYAKLVGCELRIAIFWSKQQQWTLIPASALAPAGKWLEVAFVDALMANDMGSLGDKLIGCGFPVTIRGSVRKRAGKQRLQFDDQRFFIGEQEITQPNEKRLLFFLMMWGEWSIAKTAVLEDDDTRRVTDVVFMPTDEARGGKAESGSDCVLNAFLSTVLSRYWLQFTSNDDGKFRTMLPSRDVWSTQLLELTDETSRFFAVATVLPRSERKDDELATGGTK
jgi:hypothetical protein